MKLQLFYINALYGNWEMSCRQLILNKTMQLLLFLRYTRKEKSACVERNLFYALKSSSSIPSLKEPWFIPSFSCLHLHYTNRLLELRQHSRPRYQPPGAGCFLLSQLSELHSFRRLVQRHILLDLDRFLLLRRGLVLQLPSRPASLHMRTALPCHVGALPPRSNHCVERLIAFMAPFALLSELVSRTVSGGTTQFCRGEFDW